MNEIREYPNWIDAIAIDPTGEIYGFDGDAYWVDTEDGSGYWIPIDDFDGLRIDFLGTIDPIPVELAKQMYFRREPQEFIEDDTAFDDDFVGKVNEGVFDFLFVEEIDDRGNNKQD